MGFPRDPSHLSLFGIVPVSWSSLVVLAVTVAALAAGLPWLVARTGWRRTPLAVAGVLLAATLALTWGGSGSVSGAGLSTCATVAFSELPDVLVEVGHDLESALNAALLVPLGAALVLATRRAAVPAAVVVLLPVVIEATQRIIPGRVCSVADFLLNVSGGIVGVGLGLAVLAWHRLRARPNTGIWR